MVGCWQSDVDECTRARVYKSWWSNKRYSYTLLLSSPIVCIRASERARIYIAFAGQKIRWYITILKLYWQSTAETVWARWRKKTTVIWQHTYFILCCFSCWQRFFFCYWRQQAALTKTIICGFRALHIWWLRTESTLKMSHTHTQVALIVCAPASIHLHSSNQQKPFITSAEALRNA